MTCLTTVISVALLASTVNAGSILLGGDDLTDHGSVNAANETEQGWKYIRLAVKQLLEDSTLENRNGRIALIGSEANFGADRGGKGFNNDAGDAYFYAAQEGGFEVDYINGSAAITAYLADVDALTERPSVLALAGSETINDVDAEENAVLTASGAIFQRYADRGGSIISHGSNPSIDVYEWLLSTTGIGHIDTCNSSGATLTEAGRVLFPTLTDSDIDGNAGPCHQSFTNATVEGSAFQPLALDYANLIYVMISRGAIVEHPLVRVNCSMDTTTTVAGTWAVSLDTNFSVTFSTGAGVDGDMFHLVLRDALNDNTDFSNLGCVATVPGVFQASCPSPTDLNNATICFTPTGSTPECSSLGAEFTINGLGCPTPPCPICDPEGGMVCDQTGKVYDSECQLNRFACLFPGQPLTVAPCPTPIPTPVPTAEPTNAPSPSPTGAPTAAPTPTQTSAPTSVPTPEPSPAPTPSPTSVPTPVPSPTPTDAPTDVPSPAPTPIPTDAPTSVPTPVPSPAPTNAPTSVPSPAPTPMPTSAPTSVPTPVPSPMPTNDPTSVPTPVPSPAPTSSPTSVPTPVPSPVPTDTPTSMPTPIPSPAPTSSPTSVPTPVPSPDPTDAPTSIPSPMPTPSPTLEPTSEPTVEPTPVPSPMPTADPTVAPTLQPTAEPTAAPTPVQTAAPTDAPTSAPTGLPTPVVTSVPTAMPTPVATHTPTDAPTPTPTTPPPTLAPGETYPPTLAPGETHPPTLGPNETYAPPSPTPGTPAPTDLTPQEGAGGGILPDNDTLTGGSSSRAALSAGGIVGIALGVAVVGGIIAFFVWKRGSAGAAGGMAAQGV